MSNKCKWILISALFAILIIRWLFWNNSHTKQPLNELHTAQLEVRNAKAKLDSALELNQLLANSNTAFQQKVKAMDSILKRTDNVWRVKEQQLQSQLNEMKKSMQVVHHQRDEIKAHLPQLPVGQLKEIKQNQKQL